MFPSPEEPVRFADLAGTNGSGPEEPTPPRLGRTPKEGERILAPTRRPDGTLRKPIRIRAGYVPQDEIAIYQSKGARMKKSAEAELPPGYDPSMDAKAKTKSAKRNERKKEKKLQVSLLTVDGKGKDLDSGKGRHVEYSQDSSPIPSTRQEDPLEPVTSELCNLSISSSHSAVPKDHSGSVNPDPPEGPNLELAPAVILDRKIRAIKKKIRLAEAQEHVGEKQRKPMTSEKVEKMASLLEKLRILEDEKATLSSSS